MVEGVQQLLGADRVRVYLDRVGVAYYHKCAVPQNGRAVAFLAKRSGGPSSGGRAHPSEPFRWFS